MKLKIRQITKTTTVKGKALTKANEGGLEVSACIESNL